MAMNNPDRRLDMRRFLHVAVVGVLCLLCLGTAGCGKDEAEDSSAARLNPPPGSELNDLDTPSAVTATDSEVMAEPTQEAVTSASDPSLSGSTAAAEIHDSSEPPSRPVSTSTAKVDDQSSAGSGRAPAPTGLATAAPAPTRGGAATRGPYVLQVGSFQRRERASDRVTALRDAGIEAEIVEAFVDGLLYHRVFVMGQASLDEATWLGERLAAEHGFSYLVRKQP